jgi:hypothetical protein
MDIIPPDPRGEPPEVDPKIIAVAAAVILVFYLLLVWLG